MHAKCVRGWACLHGSHEKCRYILVDQIEYYIKFLDVTSLGDWVKLPRLPSAAYIYWIPTTFSSQVFQVSKRIPNNKKMVRIPRNPPTTTKRDIAPRIVRSPCNIRARKAGRSNCSLVEPKEWEWNGRYENLLRFCKYHSHRSQIRCHCNPSHSDASYVQSHPPSPMLLPSRASSINHSPLPLFLILMFPYLLAPTNKYQHNSSLPNFPLPPPSSPFPNQPPSPSKIKSDLLPARKKPPLLRETIPMFPIRAQLPHQPRQANNNRAHHRRIRFPVGRLRVPSACGGPDVFGVAGFVVSVCLGVGFVWCGRAIGGQ